MMRGDLGLMFFAGFFSAGLALAEVPDPTRPPDSLLMLESASGVAFQTQSGVNTVILRRDGKSAAVINGQYVEVGGMLGDKKVLNISESEVVLKGDNGREVIRLTPAIEKTPVKKTASVKRSKTENPRQ
jgi:hypothetical protein